MWSLDSGATTQVPRRHTGESGMDPMHAIWLPKELTVPGGSSPLHAFYSTLTASNNKFVTMSDNVNFPSKS